MAKVHPGQHDDVQHQQHGGANDPQADPSHGPTLNQAANATLTGQVTPASDLAAPPPAPSGVGACHRSTAPLLRRRYC